MRELRNVYPNVDPRAVRFTEADWYKIESAGKQKLSAKQRERIWWISFLYVSLHNADPIDGGLIEERFQTIIDHAEALMRTLRMNTHITSVDYYVSTTLNKELMGEKWSQLDPLLTLTPLPPAWYALKDVIRAAKAALPKLQAMTVEKRRKGTKPITVFILEMQGVFEAAGGRATIGTKRIPNDEVGDRYKNGSVFSDFVHAVHSVLAAAEENRIPHKDVSSIGNYIKRALRGKKSKS